MFAYSLQLVRFRNSILRTNKIRGKSCLIFILEKREVIQKQSYVSSTDSIRTPHEINNKEDQQEPLEDVENFQGAEGW